MTDVMEGQLTIEITVIKETLTAMYKTHTDHQVDVQEAVNPTQNAAPDAAAVRQAVAVQLPHPHHHPEAAVQADLVPAARPRVGAALRQAHPTTTRQKKTLVLVGSKNPRHPPTIKSGNQPTLLRTRTQRTATSATPQRQKPRVDDDRNPV